MTCLSLGEVFPAADGVFFVVAGNDVPGISERALSSVRSSPVVAGFFFRPT